MAFAIIFLLLCKKYIINKIFTFLVFFLWDILFLDYFWFLFEEYFYYHMFSLGIIMVWKFHFHDEIIGYDLICNDE